MPKYECVLDPTLFQGISYQQLDFLAGFYFIQDHRDRSASRIITSYRYGSQHKRDFFKFYQRFGYTEIPDWWELHHIVERRHFAYVDFEGRLGQVYDNELPCVLILGNYRDVGREHDLYTRLHGLKQTKTLFLPKSQFANAEVISRETHQLFLEINTDRSNYGILENRLGKLKQLYQSTYLGDPVLMKIAMNTIDLAGRKLRARGLL